MAEQTALSVLVSAVIFLCVAAVLGAVWLDFRKYGKREDTRLQKRSVVATGTMLLFFCLYYLVLRFQLGVWVPAARGLRMGSIAAGLLLVILGAGINLWGRYRLRENWANHIKIYADHSLVTDGPFRYVRHPLYSSLFLMFYGGCLLYANWLGVLLTSLIFVPMMNYRAGQEETLLRKAFPAYLDYQKKAGRFLPKSVTGYRGGQP